MSDHSDETEGRALYRAHADTLARSQMAIGKRRVKLSDPGRLVPHHGSGPAQRPAKPDHVLLNKVLPQTNGEC